MKQIWKRLKSKTGETLVESLAAILIFTFGSIIMLSMISSAMNINKKAEAADAKYLADMQVVEKAETPEPGPNYVVFGNSAEELRSSTQDAYKVKAVDVFGGTEGSLYAYYVKGGG